MVIRVPTIAEFFAEITQRLECRQIVGSEKLEDGNVDREQRRQTTQAARAPRGSRPKPADNPVLVQAAPVATQPARHPIRSWNPVGQEHVEFSRLFRVPVGHPDETFAVRREHGKTVELSAETHAFQPRTILVDEIQVKLGRPPSLRVSTFDEKMTRWPSGWKWREIRGAIGRHLLPPDPSAFMIKISSRPGSTRFCANNPFVLIQFLLIGGMLGTIDDPLAVGRKERPTVVAHFMSQPPRVSPVEIHRIDLQIPVAHGGPDDRLPVGDTVASASYPGVLVNR